MTEHPSRASHETTVSENPPMANQLFRLAAHAMSTGRSTNKLRTMQSTPRAYFHVQEMHYFNEASLEIADYPTEIRHRMAVRIGRKVVDNIPIKKWSMRMFDTLWYEQPEGEWDGIRTTYRFEWDRNTTTLAERMSYFVPKAQQPEMDYYLEHASLIGRSIDLMDVALEMSQVTAGDCEVLIADVASYYAQQALLQQRRGE